MQSNLRIMRSRAAFLAPGRRDSRIMCFHRKRAVDISGLLVGQESNIFERYHALLNISH